MASTAQIITLCLALLHGAYSNISTPLPAITCCISGAITPTSPCYTTTTAAPITCPFVTTSTTTQPTTETSTATTISARQPDSKPTETPLQPSFVVVPVNGGPGISPPLTYPNAVGVQGFNTTGGKPSNMFLVPPYPILGAPPVVMNPNTGQRYYVVPNPNLRGNSYSQILNVYNQDRDTGGYYWMPVAVKNPQVNNNEVTDNKTNSTV